MKKDAKRIGVWGTTGCGKSTRIREMLKTENRVIVLDPLGDWSNERGYTGYKTLNGLFKALKANWNKGFKLVLEIDEEKVYPPEVLLQISSALRVIQKPYHDNKDSRMITLVIDEMADFYPNMTLKADQMAFKGLVNKGRHYGVNIIGASQRLAEVHTNFRANCKEHYFFMMGNANDYNAAALIMGREHMPDHRALSEHEYLFCKAGQIKSGKNKANF